MALLRKLISDQQRTVAHWGMELVVVIAGVLIALWLQDWAERRRAMQNMAADQEAIHDEVRQNLFNLIWRDAISRCHVERAQMLKSMLLTGQSHWPGVTENALVQTSMSKATGVESVIQGVYQRPFEEFSTAAWTSALTTGALAPMDRERFSQLVAIYNQIDFLNEIHKRENDAASTLSALAVPQELTADTRLRMFQALYEVDTARFMFAYQGTSVLAGAMKRIGWNDKAEIDRLIAEDEQSESTRSAKWRPCVRKQLNPFAETANYAAAA